MHGKMVSTVHEFVNGALSWCFFRFFDQNYLKLELHGITFVVRKILTEHQEDNYAVNFQRENKL